MENWHSIVRPHLAVHRTWSTGLLALLAVWRNHQIAPRSLHKGLCLHTSDGIKLIRYALADGFGLCCYHRLTVQKCRMVLIRSQHTPGPTSISAGKGLRVLKEGEAYETPREKQAYYK